MASIKVSKGAEDVAKLLANLSREGTAIGKMATYEGAKVIADGLRQQIQQLPEDKYRLLGEKDEFSVIAKGDKEDLLNSLGIDQITRDEDGVRTVIGFAGYGRFRTKKYPRGLPMPLLARAIESGSSVRRAHPFVRPLVSAKRKEARAAMIKAGNEAIEKITKKELG